MSLAIVFPGQGSQSLGMLGELGTTEPSVGATFAEASDALGYDLWDLCQNGPADRLNSTEVTQPAMLAAGVAVYRAWQRRGGADPAFFAGHSLGEYTALVCAGALEFTAATLLVEFRGKAMQQAVPGGIGAMAAVLGLGDEQVEAACRDAAEGEVVEPVNYNSPGQVVIAGHKNAVERAGARAAELGAKKVIPLPVSVPSHCALMRGASEQLAGRLAETRIEPPVIPVIHNADMTSHSDPDAIRKALVEQLFSPVRWVGCIEAMIAGGTDHFVECGPGKVLAGLGKRIDRSIPSAAVYDNATLQQALGDKTA